MRAWRTVATKLCVHQQAPHGDDVRVHLEWAGSQHHIHLLVNYSLEREFARQAEDRVMLEADIVRSVQY